MKNEKEKMEIAAKQYAGIPIDRVIDGEERYFNSKVMLYDAFIAGCLYIRSLKEKDEG